MEIIFAAVIVAAAAIVLQTVLLFAMYRSSRAQREQLTQLAAKLEPLAERSQRLVEEMRQQVGGVTARANEVLELSRKQLLRADEFLEDVTTRARAQVSRAEMVLDDTMARFQETVALLNRSILQPLRQLHGLTLGIRATLAALFGERRTTVERATHDEEMFI
jgi:ABC-type transporter Mla subunit MlaD